MATKKKGLKNKKAKYIYRSAVNGRVVTEKFAKDNPDITVREKK